MKVQICENLGEGGLQAGNDEFILRFELAAVTPVPQDSENILPCGMQVEVAALSGTIGLQAPEVVTAVDVECWSRRERSGPIPPRCPRRPQSECRDAPHFRRSDAPHRGRTSRCDKAARERTISSPRVTRSPSRSERVGPWAVNCNSQRKSPTVKATRTGFLFWHSPGPQSVHASDVIDRTRRRCGGRHSARIREALARWSCRHRSDRPRHRPRKASSLVHRNARKFRVSTVMADGGESDGVVTGIGRRSCTLVAWGARLTHANSLRRRKSRLLGVHIRKILCTT